MQNEVQEQTNPLYVLRDGMDQVLNEQRMSPTEADKCNQVLVSVNSDRLWHRAEQSKTDDGYFWPMTAEPFSVPDPVVTQPDGTRKTVQQWEVMYYPDDEGAPEHYAVLVAEDHGSPPGTDERLAHLFSAAADMLHAAERVLDDVMNADVLFEPSDEPELDYHESEQGRYDRAWSALETLAQAIAKARGDY